MDNATIATIGTFDGLHRGHQLLLRTLAEQCSAGTLRRSGPSQDEASDAASPLVISFDRHPLEVVAPQRAPKRLLSEKRREELFRQTGLPFRILPFDRTTAAMTAREWIREIKRRFGVRALVLGYDNRFGRDGRELSRQDLLRIGEQEEVRIIFAPELPGISSSAIRRAIADGDVAKARDMLGRPPELEGMVGRGQQLGRTIGFPTANLRPEPRMAVPKPGVYAARAVTTAGVWPAMVNIGHRPTVGQNLEPTIEANLIGFDGDLYGQPLRLEFIKRIRDERKFPSLEALRKQLDDDRITILAIFNRK